MKKTWVISFVFLFMILACQTAQSSNQLNSANKVVAPSRTLVAHLSATPIPQATVFEPALSHATITFYYINGSTEDELRTQMLSLGPVDPQDNKPMDAYTMWHIYWNWDGYGTRECNLDSAEVTYEIVVTLPRWQPAGDVSPRLIKKWNEYMRALSAHEQSHIDHVVGQITTIREAIQNATCGTAEEAAQAAIRQLNQWDIDYDARTKHGALEGVIFP